MTEETEETETTEVAEATEESEKELVEVTEEVTEEEAIEEVEAIESYVDSDEEVMGYIAKNYGEIRKGYTWGYYSAGDYLVHCYDSWCDCREECSAYDAIDKHDRTVETIKVCHQCSKY